MADSSCRTRWYLQQLQVGEQAQSNGKKGDMDTRRLNSCTSKRMADSSCRIRWYLQKLQQMYRMYRAALVGTTINQYATMVVYASRPTSLSNLSHSHEPIFAVSRMKSKPSAIARKATWIPGS
jgi:hypothetical protein